MTSQWQKMWALSPMMHATLGSDHVKFYVTTVHKHFHMTLNSLQFAFNLY
jgi:hypothetical protein